MNESIWKADEKGRPLLLQKDSTVVVSWKDKRPVHMLRTRHKGSRSQVSYVNIRWPNRPQILKPHVMIDYVKHMGGVDRSDNFVSVHEENEKMVQ